MLSSEAPEVHRPLEVLTEGLWRLFEDHAPVDAMVHAEAVASLVHRDWWIGGFPFTSGIINHIAALPYHRDSGNIAASWSAMLALRSDVEGGHLDLPEYGITFAVPDRSVILFDGQAAFHGVTPLRKTSRAGYRYTIVYYAKRGMSACGCMADEPTRAAVDATRKTEARFA